MKNKKGLTYAAAALVLLCAVYAAVGQAAKGAEKKQQQKEEQERIYMTDIPSVKAISYDYEGEVLAFTKNEGRWNYDGDELFPVKQEGLDSLSRTVSKLLAVRRLENGDDLSAYGLETPARRISVTGEDGSKAVILLGASTEAGDYYALLEGEDTPYLIDSALFEETGCSLEDRMELQKFPAVTGSDIQSITITKEGVKEEYIKKKTEGETETIEWYRDSPDEPENKLENNSPLNVLADSISSLSVKRCVNYKVKEEELAGYGLAEPSTVITYTYDKNGTAETFRLEIGALNEDGTCYYTRTEDSPYVNEIDQASVDKCLTVEEEI